MNSDLIMPVKNEFQMNIYSPYLVIFSFLCIFVDSILLLIIPPVSQYELSIYGAFPLIFWICMATGIIISLLLILLSAIYNNTYWKYGIVAIFFWYFILFLLPVFRGYAFFAGMDGDVFDHFTFTLSILSSGFLSNTDIYPISHLLLAILNVFGIDFTSSFYIINAFFSFLYILSFYILGKVIFKNNNALFFLFFSVPLLYSYYQTSFYPFIFALFMVPLVLYALHNLIQSRNAPEFRFITFILILTLVFFHPLVVIYLLIILMIMRLFILKGNPTIFPVKNIGKHIDLLLVFCIVSFIFWMIQFSYIVNFVQVIITSLFNPTHTTIAQYSGNFLAKSNISFLQLIEIIIKLYGSIILYALLGTICFVYLIKNFSKSKFMDSFSYMYAFITVLAVLSGMMMFFSYFIISEPIRIISFAIVMATILCSLVFSELFQKITSPKKTKLFASFLIVIVSVACILGMFNLYLSPWDWEPSPDITKMEIDGTDWTLTFFDRTLPLNVIVSDMDKYVAYYQAKPGLNHDQANINTIKETLPSHFGYNNNSTILKTVSGQHQYLILKESVKQMQFVVPKEIVTKIPRFSESDYVRLNTDPTANKIYTNPGIDVFKL